MWPITEAVYKIDIESNLVNRASKDKRRGRGGLKPKQSKYIDAHKT
jgi:hypothetical protein